MDDLLNIMTHYDDYMKNVKDIIEHPEIQSMSQYIHHGQTNCLVHSIHVSFISYKLGEKLHMDKKALARSGLLHDFYLYDWHKKDGRKGFHGMTHAGLSIENASKYFTLNNKEIDIIKKHMWPLNPRLPRYKESILFMFVDRYCSVLESFHRTIIKGE